MRGRVCERAGGADPEVVHPAGAADAHPAFGVEPVIPEAVVPLCVPAGWCGFGCGAVGLAGSSSLQSAVRATLVVVRAELVELALQLGGVPGGWPGREPTLQGLVEPLGLALGLGMAWGSVLLLDAE